MNTLMIIGFAGMTGAALYYWNRTRYLTSVIQLADMLVAALAAKLNKAEGKDPKAVIAIDITEEIQKRFPDEKEG